MIVKKLTKRHLPDVLVVERQSFRDPWSESQFREVLGERRLNRGYVALCPGNIVVGFLIYSLHVGDCIEILNLAVLQDCRRQGVGLALIEKVKDLLTSDLSGIILGLRESNLVGQLFFKSSGFVLTNIMKDYFCGEDAYCMNYLSTTKEEQR